MQNKNNLEPFLRAKLLVSVYESLKHRKTAVRDADALTDTILSKVVTRRAEASCVERESLVSATVSVLKRFDKAAATYYSAYHPLAQ